MSEDFERRLGQYADVIIKIGLNVQPGQRLHLGAAAYSGFIEGVPLSAAQFARLLAAKAYQAGARYVDLSYEDELLTLTRFQYAPRDSFDEFSPYAVRQSAEYMDEGNAILTFLNSNPELLSEQDPELVEQAQQKVFENIGELWHKIESNMSNWTAVSVPTEGWAAKVLPDVPAEERMERMWGVILDMCRIYGDDPVSGWRDHIVSLAQRSSYLNDRRYQALKYRGPGTDLTVGLPKGHLWQAGSLKTRSGFDFVANLPTEEVFSMPHREKIDGVVKATRPLVFGGSMIEDFSLTFKNGRVVEAVAAKGQGLLDNILNHDEGSRSLGEISLLPHSSPISQSGLVFYNILYDENASCHMAIGNAYRFSMEGAADMSAEEFAAAGGNQSPLHLDFMMGSAELDVDGVNSDGTIEPVMRAGEWTIDV